MKLTGGRTRGWTRRFASKGTVEITEYARWGITARKWRRKQGPPTNRITQQQVADFTQAQQLVRMRCDADMNAALINSANTPLTWRDLSVKMVYGTLVEVVQDDGTVIMGYRMADATIQALLDSITTDIGTLIYRSSDGWVALEPGTTGQVLATFGANQIPGWSTVGPGSGGGLFSPILSTTPTMANTGLTTWANKGVVTESDDAMGLTLYSSGVSSTECAWLYKTAPTPPYTVTACIAIVGRSSNNCAMQIGWLTPTTGKAQAAGITLTAFGSGDLVVTEWTSFTAFNSNNLAVSGAGFEPVWIALTDDGTDVHFSFSADGEHYVDGYAVAKASGYLGASGYGTVGVMLQNQAAQNVYGTILSWEET